MTDRPFVIRPTVDDDWQQLRGLRLEMLADTPIAFEEHLENAERRTESDWRMRAARGETPTSTTLVAIRDDGTWIGTMGAYLPAGRGVPYLVAVYVTPSARGRSLGVSDALLAEIEAWAAERGERLLLEVHELNSRARRFYEQRGFVLTGATRPYPFDVRHRELEMVKSLV